jgi:hypothetical protein
MRYLIDQAVEGLGLRKDPFSDSLRTRWVLIDVKAEKFWGEIPRSEQQQLRAIVVSDNRLRVVKFDSDRLEDIGVYNGMVFHLYEIEDINYRPQPRKIISKLRR